MRKLEKYTGEKTYMFPNGELAPPEAMLAKFPALGSFAHIIETDEGGEVCFAVQNLSAMRSLHGIDAKTAEKEAIAAIETIINAPPEIDTTSADLNVRLVSALETLAVEKTAMRDEIVALKAEKAALIEQVSAFEKAALITK